MGNSVETNRKQRVKSVERYGTSHHRTWSRVYKCKFCGKDFHPFNVLTKYCSIKCAGQARPQNQTKTCLYCKKEFPSHKGKTSAKFCSVKCYFDSLNVPKKCLICGKEYVKTGSKKYCSRACSHKGAYGKYKKTKISRTYLDSLWARAVKKLANNKCEYCGKEETLNSHHLFSRNNHSVRWDVENGICLCVSHHRFGKMSAHQAPLEFAEWVKERRGVLWFNALRKKAKTTYLKLNDEERDKIALLLRAIIEEK